MCRSVSRGRIPTRLDEFGDIADIINGASFNLIGEGV